MNWLLSYWGGKWKSHKILTRNHHIWEYNAFGILIPYQFSFETENVCYLLLTSISSKQDRMKDKKLWVISHHSFQPVHVVGHPESKQILIWANSFLTVCKPPAYWACHNHIPRRWFQAMFLFLLLWLEEFFSKARIATYLRGKSNCKTLFLLTCKPSAPQSHPDSCPPHRPGNLQ